MALFNKGASEAPPASSQPRPMPATVSPMQLNMVGQGATFEGVLRTRSDTSISGKVVGKIFVEGRLVITQEGIVEGEVNATNADVAGKVIGDVNCDERLSLKGTGIVDGNIRTKKLAIEDGASFTGKCNMTGNDVKAPEPDAKPAAAPANEKTVNDRFATQPGTMVQRGR